MKSCSQRKHCVNGTNFPRRTHQRQVESVTSEIYLIPSFRFAKMYPVVPNKSKHDTVCSSRGAGSSVVYIKQEIMNTNAACMRNDSSDCGTDCD